MEKERKEKKEMKLRDKGKLFIGGLNHATTSEGLKAYFSRFGKVVDASVVRFPDTSRSRGYGFVTFADPAKANVALTAGIHVLDGRNIDVTPFSSKDRPSGPKKKLDARLFLGGVPAEMKEEDLKNFFTRYGEVDVTIPRDKASNKPRGFAFLSFQDEKAAEKCLSESFVFFGGKRVNIKKAEDRSKSKELRNGNAKEDVDCLSSDAGCVDHEDDAASVYSHSSGASVDKESKFEESTEFIKLLEDYFQLKMARCKSTSGVETTGDLMWQPDGDDISEIERLLTNFLLNSQMGGDSDEDSSSDYNGMNFDDISDGDSDDNDDDSDDNEPLPLARTNALDDLSGKLSYAMMEGLVGEPYYKQPPYVKSSARKDSEFPKPPVPFNIKVEKGSLVCSVCQWTAPNGSSESFLQHCKTTAHRMKIKDRFPTEEIQKSKGEIKTSEQQTNEINASVLLPEMKCEGTRQRESGTQNERRKKQPETGSRVSRQQKPKCNSGKEKTEKPLNPSQKLQRNQLTDEKDETRLNLKVQALAKGMVCIQPVSPHVLSCKMCNKIIPKAADFNTLMKNVSFHLHSKKHIKKLSETENSLKTALEKNKNTNKGKNVVKNSDANTWRKVEINKKKSEDPAVGKINFLCLFCNYFASKERTFKSHLESQSHLASIKNVNPTSHKCNNCNRLLFGSLYDINKHHCKCDIGKPK